MNNEIISLLLYPIQLVKINNQKIESILQLLNNEFKNLSNDDLVDLLEIKLSAQDIKRIAGNIPEKDKIKYFKIAKSIVELVELSKDQIKRLAEIGKVLKIDIKDTDFKYDIYNLEEINNFEFKKTVRSFSIVAAAIGFIPFVPVSDYIILSVIHIGMISKISSIYNFKINPKEFLKLISGTLGVGFILKYMSKLLNSIIPFLGWAINASIAYSGTYAIGILARRYIEEKGELTKESIKSIWRKSYKEGKDEFWELKDYILKKKDQLIKEIEKYRKKNNRSNNDTKSVDIKDIKGKTKTDKKDTRKKAN